MEFLDAEIVECRSDRESGDEIPLVPLECYVDPTSMTVGLPDWPARAEVLSAESPIHWRAMQVEVHLDAELLRLAPNNRGVLTVDVPEGAHVANLLQQ
jgi:hypothetical protein